MWIIIHYLTQTGYTENKRPACGLVRAEEHLTKTVEFSLRLHANMSSQYRVVELTNNDEIMARTTQKKFTNTMESL